MSPALIDPKVVAAKHEGVRAMLGGISKLPLDSLQAFTEDPRMVAAGESYLRRALEALLDLGRHVLAKGFGRPVPEYAAIADALEEEGVLPQERASVLRKMARYRNRMVHFYDEVSPEELYEILTVHRADVETGLTTIETWLSNHPERIRSEL